MPGGVGGGSCEASPYPDFRQHNAFEQAELTMRAALEPTIARRAKRGEFVKCLDHFDLLQTVRN